MIAKDLLSKEVIRINPDDSIEDVGNLLLNERRSAAVVVDGKKIIGMVSKEGFVLSVMDLMGKRFDETTIRKYMDKTVDTIDENAPLADVVTKLLELPNRIERLPVTREGELAGIITKGDIVKIYAKEMAGRFKVQDLMQYKPAKVSDYSSLKDVIGEIEVSGEKRVFVMSGKKVIGIITILDLACLLFAKMKDAGLGDVITNFTAADLIRDNLYQIGKNDDAAEAAKLMVEKHIGGLPVIERSLEGIITKADILKGYKIATTD